MFCLVIFENFLFDHLVIHSPLLAPVFLAAANPVRRYKGQLSQMRKRCFLKMAQNFSPKTAQNGPKQSRTWKTFDFVSKALPRRGGGVAADAVPKEPSLFVSIFRWAPLWPSCTESIGPQAACSYTFNDFRSWAPHRYLRSLFCLFFRWLDRYNDRSIERLIEWLIDRAFDRSINRSISRTIDRLLRRKVK